VIDWNQFKFLFKFLKEKTMKHKKYITLLVLALLAILLTAFPVMARAQRTAFTGTSNFVETLDAGEWLYLPSGNVLARGIVETYNDANTDPRVSGKETIVSNANFKPAPLRSLAWQDTCGAPSTSKMRVEPGMAPSPVRSPRAENISTAV
jgi:hypothetical protein